MVKTEFKWFKPEEKMPDVLESEDSGFPTSRACIIKGGDSCIWMAFWDGEEWIDTLESIHFDKYYPVIWAYINTPKI